MAVLKVKSPQHPGDWPRHRLTFDTPLGFMIIGVDPISPRAFVKEEAQVCFCRTLYQTREPSIHCTRDPFSFASFPFSLSSWLRLFPWWFACLVCSFPFALVLAHVLGFALLALLLLASFHWRLFLFWLLHVVFHLGCVFAFPCFFLFHSFPFCIVPLAPARGLPVSTYCICDCLRYFFLHSLLLIRLVYP